MEAHKLEEAAEQAEAARVRAIYESGFREGISKVREAIEEAWYEVNGDRVCGVDDLSGAIDHILKTWLQKEGRPPGA